MQPASEIRSPNSSDPSSTPSAPSSLGRGRPRVLDDAKRREICAIVAGGCGLREAAKYVRCGINTIRREADRNPEFGDQLRRSEAYAQLSPLRAMQQAVGTHWRAAAWMLERMFPDRFARPVPGAFGSRHARQLMTEVLSVLSSEISDPFKYERVEKRVRGAFEYYIRASCERQQTPSDLRRAMKFFDDKNRVTGPLAQFGIATPDFDDFMSPRGGRDANVGRGPAPQPPAERGPSLSKTAHPTTEGLKSDPSPPATMTDLATALREQVSKLATFNGSTAPDPALSKPNNP